MKADLRGEVERLFHEGLQLRSGKRAAFLAEIGDAEVRVEVGSLLAAEGDRGTSVIGEAAQVVVNESLSGRKLGHFRIIREIGRGGSPSKIA